MAKKKEADIMEIWFFGLFFRNTASNFARSTDSTPSLIFLVLRKKHHRKMIWGFGLRFPNTASNFARSTDSTPSLIFLVLRKKHHRKMSWGSGRFFRILRQISLGVPTIRHRSFSLSCEKTSPKNELRFRAEFPEYGVKFRSEYRQYAIAYFPCLAKKHRRKMYWGFGLSFL